MSLLVDHTLVFHKRIIEDRKKSYGGGILIVKQSLVTIFGLVNDREGFNEVTRLCEGQRGQFVKALS